MIALWECIGGHWDAGCSRGISPVGAGPARVVVGAADVSPADGLLRDALGAGDGLGVSCSGGFDAADYGGLLWQLLFKPLVQRGLVVGRRQGGGEDSPKGP